MNGILMHMNQDVPPTCIVFKYAHLRPCSTDYIRISAHYRPTGRRIVGNAIDITCIRLFAFNL